MPAPHSSGFFTPQTRIGLAAIVLLTLSGILFWVETGDEPAQWKSATLRIGLVAAVAWLAWSDLRRLSPWACALVLLGILAVIWRPRFLPWIVCIGVILYVLKPKRRK